MRKIIIKRKYKLLYVTRINVWSSTNVYVEKNRPPKRSKSWDFSVSNTLHNSSELTTRYCRFWPYWTSTQVENCRFGQTCSYRYASILLHETYLENFQLPHDFGFFFIDSYIWVYNTTMQIPYMSFPGSIPSGAGIILVHIFLELWPKTLNSLFICNGSQTNNLMNRRTTEDHCAWLQASEVGRHVQRKTAPSLRDALKQTRTSGRQFVHGPRAIAARRRVRQRAQCDSRQNELAATDQIAPAILNSPLTP